MAIDVTGFQRLRREKAAAAARLELEKQQQKDAKKKGCEKK